MSRSYHVTEKQARAALRRGDLEPMFQVSEKSWVKSAEKHARKAGERSINRAIVGAEKARTRNAKEPFLAVKGELDADGNV